MFRSFSRSVRAGQNRDPPKTTTPERKKTLFWCKGSSKAREEMAREPEQAHSALRILQHISDFLPKEEQADVSDTNFVDAPINIYASPEEGERLIRAFIRIQQPAMRAAIIRLATQMALIKD